MMTSKEFWPCSEGKNERHCPNCRIDAAGLCARFCTFVRRRLLPYTRNEIEKEIAQNTFDAIFQNIHNMQHIRYFSSYCYQIFRNQKAEIFRSRAYLFEREQLVYGFQAQPENAADEPLNVLESYARPDEPDMLQEERTILMVQVLEHLEKMVSDEEPCAEIMLHWYAGMKEGLSQKEVAARLGIAENSFNQKLKRCKDSISKSFTS